MALAHTILTTLADSPQTGYDLWKIFEESVSCFWKATQQQIYRELSKMERQGLLTSEVVPQQGKPAKKVYSITPEGKKELIFWIHQPSNPTAIREELLVKVRAGYLVESKVIIQELEYRRRLHSEQLAHYLEKEKLFLGYGDKLPFSEKCRYLTLRRGIRYEQEWINWCEEAIALFNGE